VPAGNTAAAVLDGLAAQGILGGIDLGRWYPEMSDCILMCATELTTEAEIDALAAALGSSVAREAVAAR